MMKLVNFPNGLTISAFNEIEAKVLYHEIFSTQSYLKEGIHVSDGDCIFDVGANIGLYSLFLTRSFRNLRIYAFEPIPEIFSLLKQNVAGRNHLSEIQLFDFGLSNTSRVAEFVFDRTMSLATSMYPEDMIHAATKTATYYDWAKASIEDLHRISQIPTNLKDLIIRGLAIPGLKSILLAAIALPLAVVSWVNKRSIKQVSCRLRTISEVIRENAISKIDVMKIDTEGSELDVLMGIEPNDWQKVKQFIVEVHNVNDRLNTIVDLFESHGYHTIAIQEDWSLHRLMNIFTVYAIAAA